MKGFDVLHVKSAVKDHNKFDLSRTHLTTLQFGEILPLLSEETVPGDKFNISSNFFSRLAPLAKPTYGKFKFKTVYAFVPYHMIAADAEAWLDGKTAWEGYTPVQRWFTMGTLHGFIKSVCVTTTGATSSNTVYTYKDTSGTDVYNVYTNVGKYYVKVLNALGYAMPSMVSEQTSSYWNTAISNMQLSAYPLLAFFKLYNDYMSQSQRFNTSNLSNVLNAIKYSKPYTGIWNDSTGEILVGGIGQMFSDLRLNYENDYFTSAWQNPNNPIGTVESLASTTVPQGGTSTGTIANTNTSVNVRLNVSGGQTYLLQRTLDFLKSFDDWVRRNSYSGSRSVQQVYSRFGIKTSDYRDHYANVITTDEIPVQVGDVTATADTSNVPLGDYAGKGIMNGGKSVNIECDDYGIIFVLGYYTVTPMNPYGFDRKVLRTEPLDYYTPEFDGLGADAISVGEYFINPTDNSGSTYDNNVFGFTERYNAYRYGRDQITGEFRELNPNSMMTVWHTGRNLTAVRNAGYLVAQSNSVNTMPQFDSEYNRIFTVTSSDVDHFYLTANFNVNAIRPMLNLNQVAKLGEGDTTVPRNGNVIS